MRSDGDLKRSNGRRVRLGVVLHDHVGKDASDQDLMARKEI